jgi:hypothetical protein
MQCINAGACCKVGVCFCFQSFTLFCWPLHKGLTKQPACRHRGRKRLLWCMKSAQLLMQHWCTAALMPIPACCCLPLFKAANARYRCCSSLLLQCLSYVKKQHYL